MNVGDDECSMLMKISTSDNDMTVDGMECFSENH